MKASPSRANHTPTETTRLPRVVHAAADAAVSATLLDDRNDWELLEKAWARAGLGAYPPKCMSRYAEELIAAIA